MNPVYGDMLSVFPELFSVYYTFNMTPLKQGGFSPRTNVTPVKGILQYVRGGKLLQEDETIEATDTPYLWTRSRLEVGTFVSETAAGTTVYRICGNGDWTRTGGFECYELHSMVGATDTQTSDAGLKYGTSQF